MPSLRNGELLLCREHIVWFIHSHTRHRRTHVHMKISFSDSLVCVCCRRLFSHDILYKSRRLHGDMDLFGPHTHTHLIVSRGDKMKYVFKNLWTKIGIIRMGDDKSRVWMCEENIFSFSHTTFVAARVPVRERKHKKSNKIETMQMTKVSPVVTFIPYECRMQFWEIFFGSFSQSYNSVMKSCAKRIPLIRVSMTEASFGTNGTSESNRAFLLVFISDVKLSRRSFSLWSRYGENGNK